MDKKKILIIDDERDMAEMEMTRLRASGYDVDVTYDAHSGLAKAREWMPDLIILDIMLPQMDGYQVCYALKRDTRCKEIPIILVSALDEIYDTDKGRKMGADFYFTKPFDPASLLAKTRELIRQKPQN